MVMIARLDGAEDVYLGTTEQWVSFAASLAKPSGFPDVDFMEGTLTPKQLIEMHPEFIKVSANTQAESRCKWNFLLALQKAVKADCNLRFDVNGVDR